MKRVLPALSLLCLLILLAAGAGCTTEAPPAANLSVSELADQYLAKAGTIRDYRSEYVVTSGRTGDDPGYARIMYDYKSPSFARMEVLESGSRLPGTFATTNGTSTAWYNADSGTFDLSSRTDIRREYDYQSMVRQIVSDRGFSIIDRDRSDSRDRYLIEVVTAPWSDEYTPYISSRVRAWVEPSTGLAWMILTYYDPTTGPTLPPGMSTPTLTPATPGAESAGSITRSDVPNREVQYESIEVNCGLADSHFDFVAPEGSEPRCVPRYVNYVEPPRTDTSVPITRPLPGGVRYSLNESDSGRTIEMYPGEVLEIDLRVIPTLAYRWIMPTEGSGLELMNAGTFSLMPEDIEVTPYSFKSIPGYYRMRFLAVGEGTTVFDGIFALDGCDIGNAKRFNLTVHVVARD